MFFGRQDSGNEAVDMTENITPNHRMIAGIQFGARIQNQNQNANNSP